jgi:hypothetical protein
MVALGGAWCVVADECEINGKRRNISVSRVTRFNLCRPVIRFWIHSCGRMQVPSPEARSWRDICFCANNSNNTKQQPTIAFTFTHVRPGATGSSSSTSRAAAARPNAADWWSGHMFAPHCRIVLVLVTRTPLLGRGGLLLLATETTIIANDRLRLV